MCDDDVRLGEVNLPDMAATLHRLNAEMEGLQARVMRGAAVGKARQSARDALVRALAQKKDAMLMQALYIEQQRKRGAAADRLAALEHELVDVGTGWLLRAMGVDFAQLRHTHGPAMGIPAAADLTPSHKFALFGQCMTDFFTHAGATA